jgi:deazaflavin-dependent oxidoreductase (nitroreductase family)
MERRRINKAIAKYLVNPPVKALGRLGVTPGVAILETIGRKSGQPRRNPVGNGLDGDTFWIVSEHGRYSDYVRNIKADPRVRVKIGRRWRSGTAHLMPDDDTRERQRKMGRPINAASVRLLATDPLTVRIDLDPS